MKKQITLTHELRAIAVRYLNAKKALADAKTAEAEAKKNLASVMNAFGTEWNGKGKSTDYAWATIQEQGQARHIVYKETSVSGSIDWQAYARTLPGFNEEDAEQYRRDAFTRATIDYATDKQEEEIARG